MEQVALPIDSRASSKYHQVSHKSRKLSLSHLPSPAHSEDDVGLKPEFSRTLCTILSSYKEEQKEGGEDKKSDSCTTQNKSKPAVVVEGKVETPE